MSETITEIDINTDEPWAEIHPEATVTTVHIHGDEPMAHALRAFARGVGNFVDLAVQQQKRYIDTDPNRVWANLDMAKGAEAYRPRRMVDLLGEYPNAAEGILNDVHNTHTDTPPFVIVPEAHLFGEDEEQVSTTKRLLGQIGLHHVTTLPPHLTKDLLIGRDDIFTKAKASTEWPTPLTAAHVEHGAAALQRINDDIDPSPDFLMAVHRVTDVIKVGEVLDEAKNFQWHGSSSDGFVPILYDNPAEPTAGTYMTDPQATMWGYKATEVYPLTI